MARVHNMNLDVSDIHFEWSYTPGQHGLMERLEPFRRQ